MRLFFLLTLFLIIPSAYCQHYYNLGYEYNLDYEHLPGIDTIYSKRIDTIHLEKDEYGNLTKIVIAHFGIPEKQKRIIKAWYPDGKLQSIGQFKYSQMNSGSGEFRLDSIQTTWYPNGNRMSCDYYYEGAQVSRKFWHSNRIQTFLSIYLGESHHVKEWDTTGFLKSEVVRKLPFTGFARSYVAGKEFKYTVLPNFKKRSDMATYFYYEENGIRIYNEYWGKKAIDSMLKREAENIKKINNKRKFKNFKFIRGGTFNSSTFPCTNVAIKSFYLQETEVSNKEYHNYYQNLLRDSAHVLGMEYIETSLYPDTLCEKKVKVNGKEVTLHNYFTNPEYNDYPVLGIGYYQALYYCEWLRKRIIKEKSLKEIEKYLVLTVPSMVEWEYAISGGKGFDKWLKEENPLNNFNNERRKYEVDNLVPVKTFKSHNSGLYNMIGNVSEWCIDPNIDSLTKFFGKPYFFGKDLSCNPYIFNIGECPWVTVAGGSFKDSVNKLQDLIDVENKNATMYPNLHSDKIYEIGFRPMLYLLKPEYKVGFAFDGEWYEF